MKTIKEISIVGQGLVGKTLIEYFLSQDIRIKQVVTRNQPTQTFEKINYIQSLNDLEKVDLVLVCVNDSSVVEVVQGIDRNQQLAYTSGAIGLEKFVGQDNVAVFYPLQSFAFLDQKLVPSIPILIESTNKDLETLLLEFGSQHFNFCQIMDSEKRGQLHLAAVFANNFTNHLVELSQNICEQYELDFELLKPLIMATTEKWMKLPAKELQTGPAIRKDQNVLEKHKSMLGGFDLEIYELLSKSIQN